MNRAIAPLWMCLFAACAAPGQGPVQAAPSQNLSQTEPMTQKLPDFDREWNYGDPAASEAAFRAIWEQVAQSAPLGYRAELHTQIARTLGLRGQFDEAHAELDQVESWLSGGDAMAEGLAVARMRYLLERGRAFNSSGSADKARPLFQQAFELGAAQDSPGTAPHAFHTIDAAHMLGIVEKGEQSEAWNLKALELARNSSDQRAQGWQGSLTNNLGWTFHDQGKFQKAYDLFSENHQYWLDREQPRRANIAKWSMARALRSLDRIADALAMQRELLNDWSASDGGPSGYVYEELGECTFLLEGEAAAREHFAKAYEMLGPDEWLQANEPKRLARLARLGGGEESR